jgi:hypothetical protein
MVAAQQQQIRMLVPVIIRHREVASWSLVTVADDVSHLAEKGSVIIGVARLNKPLSTIGEGANTA